MSTTTLIIIGVLIVVIFTSGIISLIAGTTYYTMGKTQIPQIPQIPELTPVCSPLRCDTESIKDLSANYYKAKYPNNSINIISASVTPGNHCDIRFAYSETPDHTANTLLDWRRFKFKQNAHPGCGWNVDSMDATSSGVNEACMLNCNDPSILAEAKRKYDEDEIPRGFTMSLPGATGTLISGSSSNTQQCEINLTATRTDNAPTDTLHLEKRDFTFKLDSQSQPCKWDATTISKLKCPPIACDDPAVWGDAKRYYSNDGPSQGITEIISDTPIASALVPNTTKCDYRYTIANVNNPSSTAIEARRYNFGLDTTQLIYRNKPGPICAWRVRNYGNTVSATSI